MRITELAKALGATQRALRYYEDVGLIVPEWGERGRRVYGPGLRRRVGAVVALRRAGLSVAEIAVALDQLEHMGSTAPLVRTLRGQLEILDSQRGCLQALLDSLEPS